MKKSEAFLKVKLKGLQDRRRRLTDDDKDRIKKLHKSGMSIHAIAREYAGKCSKRLIQFVLFPERLEKLQTEQAKAGHWKRYYNRKKLTEAKRNWWHYKKELNKQK